MKEYEKYVKEKTPVKMLGASMGRAFLSGGAVCLLGQVFLQVFEQFGADQKEAASWCSLSLIFLSVILTGTGLYVKLADWGGAGLLVPITGFANSVAAPAIEFKKEGQIFGIGCKIFTIAGPVILYGILTSWILGIIYYAFKELGFYII